MNNTNLIAFAIGAAVGSLVTWMVVKTKYERIAQEEIDSVKEVFSKRDEMMNQSIADKPSLAEYAKKIEECGYKNDFASKDYITTKDEKGDTVMVKKPYVISPEEFGEIEGYEMQSLNYYADGVLTDDWDNPIEEVEDMVGEHALDSFGEYEDDAVYVRNEIHMTDYEILRDERNFADLIQLSPTPTDE